MRHIFTAFLITLFSMYSSLSGYAQSSSCPDLIWFDEFDGTSLDEAKWNYQTGDGCDLGICGWGNNELQWYKQENVAVENGKLIITAKQETEGTKNYTSGRITTANKGDFKFGRIEASIKMPEGSGYWPAFWLLPTDWIHGGWPYSGEIDIMEYAGFNPSRAWGTLHYAAPLHKYTSKIIDLPSGQKYSDDFHVFAIEWDSTSIKWFMDDIHYHTMTPVNLAPGNWVFNERFHIILNLAIGGLGGQPNASTVFPQSYEVDYVRVYSSLNRSLKGKTRVLTDESGVVYSLPGDPTGFTYEWTVTNGTITEGAGTEKIKVDWATSDGNVHLKLTGPCSDIFEFDTTVKVYPITCNQIYDNVENERNTTLQWYTGTFIDNGSVPNPNTVNSSLKSIKYTRNNAYTVDQIIFGDLPLDEITEFENGDKSFYVDLLSRAPIGTKVQLVLQSSEKAKGTYPAGKRSTFTTYTSQYNKWETLKFTFSHINNSGVLPEEIDNIVLLLDSGSTRGDIYYIDNLRRSSVKARNITGNTTVNCNAPGESYSIAVSPSETSTFSWSVPANATIAGSTTSETISVNWGNTSGYITLTETDNNGCTAISGQLLVDVTGCVSDVRNAFGISNIQLYPNPAREEFKIECELSYESSVNIKITNALGKVVIQKNYSIQTDKFSASLSCRDFLPGTYFIEVQTEKGSSTEKLIIH